MLLKVIYQMECLRWSRWSPKVLYITTIYDHMHWMLFVAHIKQHSLPVESCQDTIMIT